MTILIADAFEPSGIDGLRALGATVHYEPALKDEALAAALARTGAEVLVVRSTKVAEAMMDGGRLALIVRAGAGVNTIDVAAASRRGIYVSNCPGRNAVAVAELTLALILALDRRIAENVAALRDGRWNKKEFSKARGLLGRTLGLIGFGNIGQEVARRAQAFGMPVLVWSRRVTADAEARRLSQEFGVEVIQSPADLMAQSDIVSFHLALTPETRGFVNAALLAHARPGTMIVNTARAEVMDYQALAVAVVEGSARRPRRFRPGAVGR